MRGYKRISGVWARTAPILRGNRWCCQVVTDRKQKESVAKYSIAVLLISTCQRNRKVQMGLRFNDGTARKFIDSSSNIYCTNIVLSLFFGIAGWGVNTIRFQYSRRSGLLDSMRRWRPEITRSSEETCYYIIWLMFISKYCQSTSRVSFHRDTIETGMEHLDGGPRVDPRSRIK